MRAPSSTLLHLELETARELTPPEMLSGIETRNLQKYQNPLGPNVDQLRSSGKSWQQIIEAAAKPGGQDLDLSPPGFNK